MASPATSPDEYLFTGSGAQADGTRRQRQAPVPECGVRLGERTVTEITQLKVFDSGPDGQITTNDNTLFMDQRIFHPVGALFGSL
jgi:hypothetical protein